MKTRPGDRARFLFPSLRGANGSRECAPDDRLRDEAIHSFFMGHHGLLRFARNDEMTIGMLQRILSARISRC
jgi:hypothetical protein